MKRVLTFALAAFGVSAFCFATAADKEEQGVVVVTPGMYAWSQTTVLRVDPIEFPPIKETNLECLKDDKSRMSLQDIADDLDNDCVMTRIDPIEQGYAFDMTCSGDISGAVSGSLIVDGDDLRLNADGNAVALGIKARVSMNASASRQGDCPAEPS